MSSSIRFLEERRRARPLELMLTQRMRVFFLNALAASRSFLLSFPGFSRCQLCDFKCGLPWRNMQAKICGSKLQKLERVRCS